MSYDPPPQPYQPPTGGPAYPPQGGQPPPQYAPPGHVAWPPPTPPGKGWGAGRITLVIVGGLLALCLVGAVKAAVSGDGSKTTVSQPATTAGKTTGTTKTAADEGGDKTFNVPAGSPMTVHVSDGAVTEATVSGIRLHKGSCGQFGADPDNGSYLIANVVVVQKKGTGSVNPLDFTFVADDGTTSNALAGALSGCTKNDLSSTNALRAGTKRSGQIAFDVKDTKGTIEYAPGGIGSEAVGSWKTN